MGQAVGYTRSDNLSTFLGEIRSKWFINQPTRGYRHYTTCLWNFRLVIIQGDHKPYRMSWTVINDNKRQIEGYIRTDINQTGNSWTACLYQPGWTWCL